MSWADKNAVVFALFVGIGIGILGGVAATDYGAQLSGVDHDLDEGQPWVDCQISAENSTPVVVCFSSGDVDLNVTTTTESGNVSLQKVPEQEVDQ